MGARRRHLAQSGQLALVLVLCLGASVPRAAGADSEAVHVVSAEDLLQCLGVRAGPEGTVEAGTVVELLDCEAEQESGRPGARFLRWRLPGREARGSLQLLGAVGAPPLCLYAPLPGHDSPEAARLRAGRAPRLVPCGEEAPAAARWHWNFWLQLAEVGEHLCLTRGLARALLEPCTRADSQETQRMGQQWMALPTRTAEALAEIVPPLRASGRFIVDARGVRVKLAGTNWVGAHMEHRVNGGLERLPARSIARLIRRFGFTHVRLNYAVEMLWDAKPVPMQRVAANPELAGRSPLEIFDACVRALTDEGLLVVINAHTSDYRWCCSLTDEQALWYNSRWSEARWLESLTRLARRYQGNDRVVGFDLRNEPRPNFPDGSNDPILVWWDPEASWGKCTSVSAHVGSSLQLDLGSFSARGVCLQEHTANLRRASEQGALAVWHGNPNALAFIEGAGAADLVKVLEQPLEFKQACLHSRVVWSVHDYSWTWRWFELADLLHLGGGSFHEIFERLKVLYEARQAELEGEWKDAAELRRKAWGFLVEDGLAPVWVGEFGTAAPDDMWWKHFTRYAEERDLDWAYWPLDGYKYPPNVTLHDDGKYMAFGQRLHVEGGITGDYIVDSYGLLNGDYRSVQFPRKLQTVLHLVPARKGPGIQGSPAVQPPEQCIFNATLHPVAGSGPLPRGFGAYANVERFPSCPARVGERRLEDDPANESAPPLVEASDWEIVRHFDELRDKACTRQGEAQNLLWEGRSAQYALLREAAMQPNPVEAALWSPTLKDAQALLMKHVQGVVTQLDLLWLLLVVIGNGVFVWVLYQLRPGHCRGGRRSLRRLVNCVCAPCGCQAATPRHRVANVAAAAWEMEHVWRPVAALMYMVAFVAMASSVARGLQGRERVAIGASAVACSAVAFADEGLGGGEDHGSNFLGFLPALSLVGDLVESLRAGSLRSNITELREHVQAFREVYQEVKDDLFVLRVAVSQPGGECAFGEVTLHLVGKAEERIDGSMVAELAKAGRRIDDALGTALDALQRDLAAFKEPVRHVKSVLLVGLRSVYDSYGHSLAEVVTLVLYVIWAFFLLLAPTLCCGSLAAARLLFNRWDDGCCGSEEGCLKPYHAQAPGWARCTWMCALVYATVALLIGLTLGVMVQEGANLCVVLDDITETGLGPYSTHGCLGLSNDTFARNMSVQLFETCFTRGGSGQVVDTIAFNGCGDDGVFLDKPDTLRGRLAQVEGAVYNWTNSLQNALNDTFLETVEVQALLTHLEDLRVNGSAPATNGTTCKAQAEYRCPALPPAPACGSCNASELVQHAAGLQPLLAEALARLDGAVQRFRGGLLTGVVASITHTLAETLTTLLRALDCGFLGDHTGNLVDAACLGVLVGIQDMSIAHYMLGRCAIFLALVEYILWRKLLHFYNSHKSQNPV